MQGGEPYLPEGVALGEVLAGRYRLDATIGRGAMGVVVAALDRRLDIPVAIKFLAVTAPDSERALARFVLEARAAARLQSEHVVRVSDVAVHNGVLPYIVMERLVGTDLAALLQKAGPFEVETAVDYILEACEAVAEAHRIDIVHRDLKPANLFLAERRGRASTLKVLDFGIAKDARLVAQTLDGDPLLPAAATTGQKSILGSPFYMSPEQMESSGEVDARTDIWALGVCLFEFVTGKPPFTGTSLVQVYARMTAPLEPGWCAQWNQFPEGLSDVIERCLKRDRAARYATVEQLALALAPFGSARARRSEAHIRKAALAATSGMEATLNVVGPRSGTPTPPEPRPTPLPAPIPRRLPVGWMLLGLSAIGLLFVFVARRPPAPSASPSQPPLAEPESKGQPPATPPTAESAALVPVPAIDAARPIRIVARTPGPVSLSASIPQSPVPSERREPVDASSGLPETPPAQPDAGFNSRDMLRERI
jgi:serine/threonine protein kinase